MHSLSEKIEISNKDAGWNKAKFEKYELYGKQEVIANPTQMMALVLDQLYVENPDRFREIKLNSGKYGLQRLFLGAGKGGEMVARKCLTEAQIDIETKLSNNDKIKFLRFMMQAMEVNEDTLKIWLRLAHRTN